MYSNTIQPGAAPASKKMKITIPIATPMDHQSGSHPPPIAIAATANMVTLPPADIFSTPGRVMATLPETPRRSGDNDTNNNNTQRRLFFSPVKFSPVKPQKDIASLGGDDKKRKRGGDHDMLDKLFRGIGGTETAQHGVEKTKLAATTPAPTMKRATISMKATPKPRHQPEDASSGTATTPWRIKIGDFGTTPLSVAPQQQTSTTRVATCTPASIIQLAPSSCSTSTIGGGFGGHDYWMCAECSSGVPSLAKPCQQCKRGVSPVPVPRGTTDKEVSSVSPHPASIVAAATAANTRSVTLSAAVSSAAAAAASYAVSACSAPLATPAATAAAAASPKRVVPASTVAATPAVAPYASPKRPTPASFASPARRTPALSSGLRLTPGLTPAALSSNLSYSFSSPRRSPRFNHHLSGPSPRLTALSHASFDFGDLGHDFLGIESSGNHIAGATLDWHELPGVEEEDVRAEVQQKKGQEDHKQEKSEEKEEGSGSTGEEEAEQAAVAFLASASKAKFSLSPSCATASTTCKSPVPGTGTQQQGKQLKSILKQKRREDKKAKRAAEAAAAVAEGDAEANAEADSDDPDYVPGVASMPPKKKKRKKKTTKINNNANSSSSSNNSNIADGSTFTLYDSEDVEHINAVHTIIRRDIWEGFVVGRGENKLDKEDNQRKFGRLTRYEGTIGFRCRFCKNAPMLDRADKACVYPRTLERIYLANIRFQRDHVEHCTFISKKVRDEYNRLKKSKGKARGKKSYWVTSAEKIGLCNGETGITFANEEQNKK